MEKLTPVLVVVKVALPESGLKLPVWPAASPVKLTLGFPLRVPGKIVSWPSAGAEVKTTVRFEEVASAIKLAASILKVPC